MRLKDNMLFMLAVTACNIWPTQYATLSTRNDCLPLYFAVKPLAFDGMGKLFAFKAPQYAVSE